MSNGGQPEAAPAAATPAAPVTAPATTTGQTPASTPAMGGLKDAQPEVSSMFENLGADIDDGAPEIHIEQNPLQTPNTPAASPAAPVVQPVVQPTAQPAVAGQTPVAQPQTPAQPAQPVAGQPAPTAAPTASPQPAAQKDLLAEIEAQAPQIIQGIAAEHFQLSPEDQELLQTDANAVISKMAAKVFYMATTNTIKQMRQLAQQLPQMMQQYMTVKEKNSEAENEFFTMFPTLKGKDQNVINQYATTFKAANPSMPRDQFFKAVGALASAHFGLPLTGQAPATSALAPNGQPFVQVPQAATGFQPASTGAASPANGTQPDNPWEALGREFE